MNSPTMKRLGQDWYYIPFVFHFTEVVRSPRWISSPNFLMAAATWKRSSFEIKIKGTLLIQGVLMIKRWAFFVEALLLMTCLDLGTIQVTVNWWVSLDQLGWQRRKELAQGSRLVCRLSWIRIPFRLHRFGAWWFFRGSHISLITFLCSEPKVFMMTINRTNEAWSAA